jgi:hypothetical protein
MKRPYFTEDQVAAALKQAGGVVTETARILSETYRRPCDRSTVSVYISKSERLQAIRDEALEVLLDYSEMRLKAHIEAGSEKSLHFLLQTKGRHRGYVKRSELSGPDGNAVPVDTQAGDAAFAEKLAAMSQDDKEQLLELLEKVDGRQTE